MPGALFFKQLGIYLETQRGPGPGPYKSVRREYLLRAAHSAGLFEMQAMIACLGRDIWPLSLSRNRGVLSAAEQARLLSSHVAIIGCGGLGGYAITLLARAGIGRLSLVDPDDFDESNLNRQQFCSLDTLGQNKAQVAARALEGIAPHMACRVFPRAARPDNLPEILNGADIVVDCLDSLASRFEAEAAALALGIPFIHGAVAGREGFVLISRPAEQGGSSAADPTDSNPQGLTSLYPDGGTKNSAGSAEEKRGVPAFSPAVIAGLQAQLTVAELLGSSRFDGLLHLDLSVPSLEIFAL